jgi:lipoprotein signal peptidase
MVSACLMVASQVLVIDQAIEMVARRTVNVLDEKPLTTWLGLVWQTVDPGRIPSPGLLVAWIVVSLVVVGGLAMVVRRSGPRFVPLQAVAIGLLLGGCFSHLVDLVRWGDVVATLHVRALLWQGHTDVARLAQWLGLLLLTIQVLGRRKSIA